MWLLISLIAVIIVLSCIRRKWDSGDSEMSQDRYPDEEIRRLRQLAIEKKFNKKAVFIILLLGDKPQHGNKPQQYSDDILKIESSKPYLDVNFSEMAPIKITTKSSGWNVVFETKYVDSDYHKTGTHLEPRESGGYDVVDDYEGSSGGLYVDGYIIGDWEQYFEELYARAVAQEESNNKRAKQLAKDNERKRFGV